MTEFNWDLMPPELRVKLLELAGMNSAAPPKWSGFSKDEKTKLNEALWNKSGGTARIGQQV